MNINEASKQEKLSALIDWVTHMDEQAMDDTLREFLGWIDDPIIEDLKEED